MTSKVTHSNSNQLVKVAFICNHNSCRSQIAEALGKLYGGDVMKSYSAGTTIKNSINADAVRLVKQMYGIDMQQTQHNKKIGDIPQPDIAVFMGCNVSCPMLKATCSYNWGLDDPSGKDDSNFVEIIVAIERNIKALIDTIKQGKL